MEVIKARKEDFSKIQKLLLKSLIRPQNKQDPFGGLLSHWDDEIDCYGYVLIDNDNVHGFLSTIFSKRVINNKIYKFCNLSSWTVEKPYRNYSLNLIFPVLNLKGYTITSLTASKEAVKVLTKLGFKELDYSQKIFVPIPFYRLSKKCGHTFDIGEIKKILNKNELKILEDHLNYKCFHSVFINEVGYTYVIFTKVLRRNLPFAYVQYISNLDFFEKNVSCITWLTVKKHGVFGVMVDTRFLSGEKLGFSFTHVLDQPRIYKSTNLLPNEIDNLYSERILLNI